MDFDQIQQLREEYEAVLDDADSRRAAYHQAIRKAFLSGASLADLAQRLGISRQRVHEIVGKEPATRRRRRKRRIVGSAIIFVGTMLIGTLAWALIDYDRPRPRPEPPPVAGGCALERVCAEWEYLLAYESATGKITWSNAGPRRLRGELIPRRGETILDISSRPDAQRIRRSPDQYHIDVKTGDLVREYTHLHLALALTGVFLVGVASLVIWNRRPRIGRPERISFNSV